MLVFGRIVAYMDPYRIGLLLNASLQQLKNPWKFFPWEYGSFPSAYTGNENVPKIIINDTIILFL